MSDRQTDILNVWLFVSYSDTKPLHRNDPKSPESRIYGALPSYAPTRKWALAGAAVKNRGERPGCGRKAGNTNCIACELCLGSRYADPGPGHRRPCPKLEQLELQINAARETPIARAKISNRLANEIGKQRKLSPVGATDPTNFLEAVLQIYGLKRDSLPFKNWAA